MAEYANHYHRERNHQGLGNKRDMRSERPPYTWHAVFRFGWDETGVVVEGCDSLIGEVSHSVKTCGAGKRPPNIRAALCKNLSKFISYPPECRKDRN